MVKAGTRSNNSFRKNTSQKTGKSSNVKRKADAAAYAKRHSVKAAKQKERDVTDVYEYVPEKTRRSKVRLELDRDEAFEFGNLDEESRESLRARLIGENEDDERIESDDDEEIDSDAAFEESDEERFAEFFPKKKKSKRTATSKSVHFADIDLDEDGEVNEQKSKAAAEDSDEESEEQGEGDEFIDLLGVLDGEGEIDMGSDQEGPTANAPKQLPLAHAPKEEAAAMREESSLEIDEEDEGEGEGDEDEDDGDGEGEDDGGEDEEDLEEEEESGDEEMLITASDEEDVDLSHSALDNLQDFVSSLDTRAQKRKAPEDAESTRRRKRRIIQEKTEAGHEDEFRVDSSGSKLNLDDLLGPLSAQSSGLQSLKKTTKILGSSSKSKALSAPLPQRAQERLDREAAYEQTKEEVDKWSNTMKRIREAEHLSFPLQAEKAGRISNLELAAKFKPTTGLESAVDALLKSAKIREQDIHEAEEGMLKANKLSLEEVEQRRAELRKMRELMFRAEVKAKRVKKIKSKTYRKLRRKEKERLAEKIDEQEDSDDEEVRMKRELERARERATLRHKHTGTWARQMRGKHLDEDGRKEMEEMLAKGEKLRRKIQGVGTDESDDDDDDDDEDEGEDPEQTIERIKAGAFDELSKLNEVDDIDLDQSDKKGKSVFAMKFMKDAMARQAVEANREADDFLKELGALQAGDDSDHEDNDEHDLDPSSGVVVHRAGGRVVYRPGATTTNNQSRSAPTALAPPPSDTSSVTLKSTDLHSPAPISPLQASNEVDASSSTHPAARSEVNPWLAQADVNVTLKASRKNEVAISKDSKSAEKSKNKLKKEARKREEERQKAKDDATLEISMDNVLQLGTSSVSESKTLRISQQQAPKRAAEGGHGDSDDSDVNSEVEAQEKAVQNKGKGKGKAVGPASFQQRDLVALAFAGDNVVKEFEEAKRREIAEDAPKEVDTTIAGWGSWGGVGLRRKPPKLERIKKIAGIDPTTRADYNKKHIIISEKKDKKSSKYLVKDLPYPYTSQAQFERSMERPLGAQWNTRVAFQRATLPRVVKKPGIVITPLEKHT